MNSLAGMGIGIGTGGGERKREVGESKEDTETRN